MNVGIEQGQNLVERFLSSPQFGRSYDVLDTFQRILMETKNAEERKIVDERMRAIFDSPTGDEDNLSAEAREVRQKMVAMRKKIFSMCEQADLTREKLAAFYADSGFGEKLLATWQVSTGDRNEEKGEVMVNEVVQFVNKGKKDKDVGINIIPTAVSGRGPLMQKIKEGFAIIAKELQSGSLQHAKKVRMISWLFGSVFAAETKAIFGKDVVLKDATVKGGAREVQHLALSYNKRAMEKYLKTGELPNVQKLILTKEEFVKKFLVE